MSEAKKEKDPKSIAQYTEKFGKNPGLFTMYVDSVSGKTYMEITEDQLRKEFIYFSYVENGVVAARAFRGNYLGSKIFTVEKVYDQLQFQVQNTKYYFDENNAVSKAKEANINNPVVFSSKVVAEDKEKRSYLIESDKLFMQETFNRLSPTYPPSYKGFKLGKISASKSRMEQLRNYPENTDVVVRLVFEGSGTQSLGPEEVTDGRFVSVTYQHSLIEVPENDFIPRKDDERIGFFSTRITDLTQASPTPYRDVINHWNLKKKNPGAPVSEVVEPITWWIENTTPEEFREYVREGAEAWNIAFEAAGYRNAIVVKEQPDDADWDTGDIRYNVLRWTSSPNPPFSGYGPSFVNPRTGQILGADVMLEYKAILGFFRRAELLEQGLASGPGGGETEPGIDLPSDTYCAAGWVAAEQATFARTAFDLMEHPEEKERLKKELVKWVVLHEVGHTLGLYHNMKGSSVHSPEELNDFAFTKSRNISNSVMEYPAVNYPVDPEAKTSYYDEKPGAYDMWAIEYGYSEALQDPAEEDARLEAILSRSSDPGLAFGNDGDDMRSIGKGIDPLVNIFDMSSDPVRFSSLQIELVDDKLMPRLLERYTPAGESYARLRYAYFTLLGHKSRMLSVISKHIGGVRVNRSVEGTDPQGVDPYTPMSEQKQRMAMKALHRYAFAPDAWKIDGELIRHLQSQRRGSQPFDGEDPKLHSLISGTQNDLLGQLLHENLLNRISNTSKYGNEYSLSEYLNDLTDAIFEDDKGSSVHSIRQNLQLSYTDRMIDYLSNKDALPNTKSEVLYQIYRIKTIAKSRAGNQSTQAHRMHLEDKIRRMEQAK